MLLVGKRNNDGTFEKDWYRQGWIFKDEEAFLKRIDDVCYIAESSYPFHERHYTHRDILNICGGNEDLTKEIFYLLDWQHPSTAFDELMKEEKKDEKTV